MIRAKADWYVYVAKQSTADGAQSKQSMQTEGTSKKLLAVVLYILTRLHLSNASKSVHTHTCTFLYTLLYALTDKCTTSQPCSAGDWLSL